MIILSHKFDYTDTELIDWPFALRFQGSRLDDQRCAPPPPPKKGPTVPDEDFFSLIQRAQAKRMDEQRVTLSSYPKRPNSS